MEKEKKNPDEIQIKLRNGGWIYELKICFVFFFFFRSYKCSHICIRTGREGRAKWRVFRRHVDEE